MSQVGWVLAHLADLHSDFLRFFPQFGKDPVSEMTGPEFFVLADRVSAYGGVMTIRVQNARGGSPTSGVNHSSSSSSNEAKVLDFAAFQLVNPGTIETVKVSSHASG